VNQDDLRPGQLSGERIGIRLHCLRPFLRNPFLPLQPLCDVENDWAACSNITNARCHDYTYQFLSRRIIAKRDPDESGKEDSEHNCTRPGEFGIARLQSNGALDPTFGNGGSVLTPFPDVALMTAVTLQSDGKILAVGITLDGNGIAGFALARYMGR
jgi:Domain of unknown function (DUF5122) beta-propeller